MSMREKDEFEEARRMLLSLMLAFLLARQYYSYSDVFQLKD
jgi:hypothetical protein